MASRNAASDTCEVHRGSVCFPPCTSTATDCLCWCSTRGSCGTMFRASAPEAQPLERASRSTARRSRRRTGSGLTPAVYRAGARRGLLGGGLDEGLELARGVHLADDVAAADELPGHEHL